MCSGVDSLEDLDVSIPTCPNASLGDVVEGRVGGWGWGEGSETGCLGDTRFLFLGGVGARGQKPGVWETLGFFLGGVGVRSQKPGVWETLGFFLG